MSLSLVNILDLKSILSDISTATPALFWFLFAWDIFFHPFTFNLFLGLDLVCISFRQHRVGSCFLSILPVSARVKYRFTHTRMAIILKKKIFFKQKITSIGKDVNKMETSYIASRNVKWLSHWGKQFDGSSENYT